MKINYYVKQDVAVHAFYLFFLVHTVQIGAGLMGVPRIIFSESGTDAWMSLILAGIYIHFTAWIMVLVLREYESADVLGIQCDLFGMFIGKVIGCLYVVYLFFLLLSVIKNYVEVVQVFIFPEIPIWLMSFFLLFLMIYCLLGGIRTVVGACFIFFLLTIWLVFTLYKPISLMNWDHFLPIGQSTPFEVLKGAYKTTYSLLGFEVILFVYPYIKNKKAVHLPIQSAIFLTIFLTMLVMVVSIGYFSPDQLKETVWATLALFKIVSFSIIERFDFIAVALWMMVIIPNLVIIGWMILHSLNRMFYVSKKKSLFMISGLLFLASLIIEYRSYINLLTDWTAKIGFWLVFVYPLFIYFILQIKKLWRKGKRA
ncbi:spore germination protein [Halobacillus yeomjeoni]|uniref:GerAB/ArcD/ProY family transporter n=1 Tax=Halobacillus yeomjeoni TaxID=311194 RepID=UPI001CD5E3FE|nr:GerAB/ArcD/ProY family transporter [Halobacillus yeomjeoni]MCA0983963.1 spore germination protein [Halobacillus yeomjeoni]